MISFNRMSVVSQLSISIGLLCAAVFVALIAVVSVSSNRAAMEQTRRALGDQADATAKLLDLSYENALASAAKGMTALKKALGTVTIDDDTVAMGKYPAVRVARAGGNVLNGDEKSGPDTAALLKGDSYQGVVMRNGRFYISSLEPIKDAAGRVVGALSARVDVQQGIDQLFESLKSIRVGETGYIHVLRPGESADDSTMLYHPVHAGKTLKEIGNDTLTRVVGEQISKKNGDHVYDWPREDGSLAPKIAAYRLSDNWGWIVSSGAHVEEFTRSNTEIC